MSNNKIIVGVHGIGDQVRYETIQSIAYQFCWYYDIKASFPLGRFHNSNGVVQVQQPETGLKLSFTEAYWADIARTVANEGYTLEETKQWAKTIVEGFRERVNEYKGKSSLQGNRNPAVRSDFLDKDEGTIRVSP